MTSKPLMWAICCVEKYACKEKRLKGGPFYQHMVSTFRAS